MADPHRRPRWDQPKKSLTGQRESPAAPAAPEANGPGAQATAHPPDDTGPTAASTVASSDSGQLPHDDVIAMVQTLFPGRIVAVEAHPQAASDEPPNDDPVGDGDVVKSG